MRCGRWIGCWRRLGSIDPEKKARRASARATQAGLLLHVVSYSDPEASHREVPGLLDDYAFTALACLDAYEATADLSYFKFARAITDAMIARLLRCDLGRILRQRTGRPTARAWACWRRGASRCRTRRRRREIRWRRLRCRDCIITPATLSYRDKAEHTLETFAGVAEQFGIFAATYGIAVVHLLESPVQVVVIAEDGDEDAAENCMRRRSRLLRSTRARCGWRPIRRSRRIFRPHWRPRFRIFPAWARENLSRCCARDLPANRRLSRCSGVAERLEGASAERKLSAGRDRPEACASEFAQKRGADGLV